MKKTLRIITLCALFATFPFGAAFAFGSMAQQDMPQVTAPALDEDLSVPLNIPVFAPEFAKTPVASVNGEFILLGDLTPELKTVDQEMPVQAEAAATALSNTFKKLLDKAIAAKKNGKEDAQVKTFAEPQISKDRMLAIRVPLFSTKFAETPVAEVNEEPILLAEFARDLKSAHGAMNKDGAAENTAQTAADLLNRLVTVRLVEQEARNIGFDQTDEIRKQVAAYAEKTLLYALLNKEVANLTPDEEETDKLYKQISLQGKFRTINFTNQDDAVALLKEVDAGKDFDTLVQAAIKAGKAKEEEQQGYIKFKDLISQVATDAAQMEVGGISKAYRKADGFVVFKLEDRQFVEDPAALQFARKTVWDKQVAGAADKYIKDLIDKYVTFNKKAEAAMDFTALKEKNPDIKLSEALEPLLKDQQVLATVKGAEPGTLTVAELANKLKATYYHGTDVALEAKEVDTKKKEILTDTLFRMAGTMVAKNMKLDQTQDYHMKVAEFERKTLFDNFLQRVVVPDVKLTGDDVKQYYDEHPDQYSTPAMLKVKSLPFYKEKDALAAQKKLQSGSDFKWVSANSAGLVDVENKDLLTFDNNILSVTALPENLQKDASNFRTDGSIVYSDPGKFYYVLYFEKIYPPEPKPFDQVKAEIRQKIFQDKVEKSLEDYVVKLKAAYPTEIFLASQKD